MRFGLVSHPDAPAGAVERLEVEVARGGPGALRLCYQVVGRIAALAVPPPALPRRGDELWRHTCFEAFLKPENADGYAEINLSPSGEWAAYRFEAYRSGMAPLDPFAAPATSVRADAAALELEATLALPYGGPLRLGISAVIEAVDGSLSYWALAHPPGKPDFHHADCFAAQL